MQVAFHVIYGIFTCNRIQMHTIINEGDPNLYGSKT